MPSHSRMPKPSTSQPASSLKWVLGYLMREKIIFIPSLAALFITAGLSLAFPYFLGKLIGGPSDALANQLDPQEVLARSDTIILQLLAVLAIQAVVAFFRVQGFIRSGESALNRLRADLFAHLVRLPMSFFQEQRSGALSNRISADLGVVRDTLLNTIPQAVRQSVILIGGLTFIFVASWKLSLIMLACIPIVVLAIAFFGRRVKQYSKAAQDSLADAGIVVEETVQSIADVKAFTNETYETTRYQSALDSFLHVTCRGAKNRAAFLSFIIFALFGTISFVAWHGARMLATGQITWENFAYFILFSIFVGASLGSFPEIISQLQHTAGATDRLRNLIEQPTERRHGTTNIRLTGEISFKNIHFGYPSRPEANVLNNLSFDVPSGARIAIVGPSGAGKSTIFSLILGLNQPTLGTIHFDGTDASSIDLLELRHHIAIVPQEVLLFGGTIRENIEYGLPGASLDAIQAAAIQANAHEFISTLPDGYETPVGPRGTKLSGGQRQRIAIARAILANPSILLLDEATSALDSESERLVNEALERLMQGRTCIVIAHRLSTVRHADHILVLNHGQLVESGSHQSLLDQNGTYRLLVETQLM